MKKWKLKEMSLRIVILIVGLFIAHLGVTLFILSDFGPDPFNVLVQGIYRSLSKALSTPLLTHGNVHICLSLVVIAVLLIVDRNYIKLGTLVCMLCGGPIIDLYTLILSPAFTAVPFVWFRGIMLPLGCVILAFGMTIVIKSDAGTGPNDLVAVVVSDKTHWKFSIIRIIVDCAFVAGGLALGGTAGIGTIICAFLVGPVAGFFLPRSEKIVNHFVSKV